MQRHIAIFPLADGQAGKIKQKMLDWAKQFSIFLFLDSNNYNLAHSSYECLLGVGSVDVISDDADILSKVKVIHDAQQDWLFGHICYDHKNTLEPKLSSSHTANIGFHIAGFFVPQTVCHINTQQTGLTIESFDDPALIYKSINEVEVASMLTLPKLQFSSRVSKQQYLETIEKLREHIADGDCYEINFCTEGYCERADVQPLQVFNALNALSPAPFAAYYKCHDKYMMCASPERYLRKTGSKILSQPIKGTARRDSDHAKDELIKEQLQNDIKERAENVMITDLVRNDLARCCETGSIMVEELFGIYTFPQVHQMISTVSGLLKKGVHFTDAIRYSFPMGSMTGAPKYKVMQLIEQYEHSRRELFSGTVGYITPAGDFDFNVVIRTLFYDEASAYLSYKTGGAITYDSVAEKEWEEMRLKAWALERIFT